MTGYMYDDWAAQMAHETDAAEIRKYERRYLADVPFLGVPTVKVRPLKAHRSPKWAVYFLFAPVCNRMKIGVTRGLASRIEVLRSCAPEPYFLLGWIPGGHAVEQAFHRANSEERRHGEWFEVTPVLRSRFETAYGVVFPSEEKDPLFD